MNLVKHPCIHVKFVEWCEILVHSYTFVHVFYIHYIEPVSTFINGTSCTEISIHSLIMYIHQFYSLILI